MEPEIVIPFLILGLLAAVAAVYIAREWKRIRGLAQCAAELGFEFEAKPYKAAEADLVPGQSDLWVLSWQDPVVYNVLKGEVHGVEVRICECQSSTGRTNTGGTRWRHTVAVFRSPMLRLPTFNVRPKRAYLPLRRGVKKGFKSIEFAGHPAFSSNCMLFGEDEDAVRGVFGRSALNHFAEAEGLCVDAGGDALAVFRVLRRVKPRDVPGFLQESFQVFALFARNSAPRA